MIERKFVSQNIKEFQIKEYIAKSLNRVGLSDVKLKRTPLGEKIVISASRPGLVVGRAGSNIQKLTRDLKEHFNLENPQIEIEEIKELNIDPAIVAESIAGSMERFGSRQFKSAGHRSLNNVMRAGALGVEILISGKIPSQRARTWRFYEGYLKKCGDVAVTGVNVAHTTAHLKSGAVGIKVSIMPKDTILPDTVEVLKEPVTIV
ncbi:30S ribosomal protein S3, partial [Candidatus Woesearchaeota archaeon]|nr:30S ribosomal protein S3 [Candidatus Woesearchaeota archaeon]